MDEDTKTEGRDKLTDERPDKLELGRARFTPAGEAAAGALVGDAGAPEAGAGDGAETAADGAAEASSKACSSFSTLLEVSSAEIAFDSDTELLPRNEDADNLPLLRTV